MYACNNPQTVDHLHVLAILATHTDTHTHTHPTRGASNRLQNFPIMLRCIAQRIQPIILINSSTLHELLLTSIIVLLLTIQSLFLPYDNWQLLEFIANPEPYPQPKSIAKPGIVYLNLLPSCPGSIYDPTSFITLPNMLV